MSKYVLADDFLKEINRIKYTRKILCKRIMQSIPSIDLIHCGDCAYFNPELNECENKELSPYWIRPEVSEGDYCSFAERKCGDKSA